MSLFDDFPAFDPVPIKRSMSIQEKFNEFDEAHPRVYALFCELVDQLQAAGNRHYSADAILHRIRWECTVNPDCEFDGFKINNNFASRYARKWLGDQYETSDFFATRELKTC